MGCIKQDILNTEYQPLKVAYRRHSREAKCVQSFLSVDPLAETTMQPYSAFNNNPIYFNDPTGMIAESNDWVPDSDGNLIAEEGDNHKTLATFLNISNKEAKKMIKDQNNGSKKVTEGQKVTLDNVYTQSLAAQKDLPTGSSELNYNCVGACDAGANNSSIVEGVGIDTPAKFDRKLVSDFDAVSPDEATFGDTVIRFSPETPFSGPGWDDAVNSGEFSRDPNKVGGHVHGAVYYGASKDGTIYVYTKNGWVVPPRIMKLNDLKAQYPSYGSPRGMNNTSGYYKKKTD